MIIFAPDKSSVSNQGDEKLSENIWAFISRILLIITVFIIFAMFWLWLSWHFLKFISPFILGFGNIIILMIPIFGKLEEAGVFKLFDDVIFNLIVFNFQGVFAGIAAFFKRSGKYVMKTVKPSNKSNTKVVADKKGKPVDKKKDKARVVKSNSSEQNTNTQEENQEENIQNQDATEESKYTAKEHKDIQTKTEMCIAEKTTPMDPESASFIDNLKARVNNSKAELLCKSQSIGEYK